MLLLSLFLYLLIFFPNISLFAFTVKEVGRTCLLYNKFTSYSPPTSSCYQLSFSTFPSNFPFQFSLLSFPFDCLPTFGLYFRLPTSTTISDSTFLTPHFPT